jgi:hypothetical protein
MEHLSAGSLQDRNLNVRPDVLAIKEDVGMDEHGYKKYTVQARTGIKGEAYFEALLADYSVPHQIVGPKDLGIDYICEWVHGDAPTGVLFAAEVKTFAHNVSPPKAVGVDKRLNGLETFEIKNSNLIVTDRSLQYWRGLGMPVYLFAIVNSGETDTQDATLDCYYRRFTAVLTSDKKQEYQPFYKANRGAHFIAFAREEQRAQGFARDLFIDFMRWSYYKGTIAYLNPRMLGLNQFPQADDAVFTDILAEYKGRVWDTYTKTKGAIEKYCRPSAEDSA